MSDDLRTQIAFSLGHKTTEELLAIWIANDRTDWSSAAFDAIQSILKQRGVALPAQQDPLMSSVEDTEQQADTPVSHQTTDVQRLVGKLERFAPIAFGATIIAGLPTVSSLYRTVAAYFVLNPQGKIIALLIAVLVGVTGIALQGGLYYFTLRSAAAILRILKQMERNSRIDADAQGAKESGRSALL